MLRQQLVLQRCIEGDPSEKCTGSPTTRNPVSAKLIIKGLDGKAMGAATAGAHSRLICEQERSRCAASPAVVVAVSVLVAVAAVSLGQMYHRLGHVLLKNKEDRL